MLGMQCHSGSMARPMIAKLEFTLPEEDHEFQTAVDGFRWKSVVWEMNEWLRQKIKYEDRNDLEPVRTALREEIEQRGLSLD